MRAHTKTFNIYLEALLIQIHIDHYLLPKVSQPISQTIKDIRRSIMQIKFTILMASALSLISPTLGIPQLPIIPSLGVPAPATSIINSVAGSTGLPILSSIVPVSAVAVPTGLSTTPVNGLTTDPTTLANKLSEAIQVLELILSILAQLSSTGLIAIPGASSLGSSVEGTLLVQLLALAKGTIPTS